MHTHFPHNGYVIRHLIWKPGVVCNFLWTEIVMKITANDWNWLSVFFVFAMLSLACIVELGHNLIMGYYDAIVYMS